MEKLIHRVIAFAANLALFISVGAILPVIWGYFLVPLGVPSIGFWHAQGIELIVGLLLINLSMAVMQPKLEENFLKAFPTIVSKPALMDGAIATAKIFTWGLALLVAWIISLLM